MSTRNKRILVCEDDRHIAEIIALILQSRNYDILTLPNGDGIEKATQEYSPDLILLDLWMPDADGMAAARIIKNNPSHKHIPIIVISALSDAQRMAHDIRADDFLAKPFEMNDLLAAVGKYTGTD